MTDHIEETKAKIAVMQAYVDGAPIECAVRGSAFYPMKSAPSWMWYEYDYRIATTPDTIDWGHVSAKFKFMARDERRDAFLFSHRPIREDDEWCCGGECCEASVLASYKAGTCDWKDSLVERPV